MEKIMENLTQKEFMYKCMYEYVGVHRTQAWRSFLLVLGGFLLASHVSHYFAIKNMTQSYSLYSACLRCLSPAVTLWRTAALALCGVGSALRVYISRYGLSRWESIRAFHSVTPI